ncbi:MAG TPA: hypothetical protein VFY14_20265 [Streptomyces sp.]|nr:hypothetical protein [Streptomyces sp.]
MFEPTHGLHAPHTQELTARDFVRDVETFVAGTTAAEADRATVTSLIEKAWALSRTCHRPDWLRWGSSGMPMTGQQIADHAEAAAQALRTAGWNPSIRAGRGIRDALIHAETTTPGRFGYDTRRTVGDILGLLIRARTGAPHAYYETWDDHPDRTVDEVLTLLAAAAAFARRYGPADHPSAATAA